MTSLDKAKEMQARTKSLALRILKLCGALPKSDIARTLGRQLIRSGTSVAANYRAVCRAKSQADFISKMGTVVEEADELVLWLELLIEARIVKPELLCDLLAETNALLHIFGKSLSTAKRRSKL